MLPTCEEHSGRAAVWTGLASTRPSCPTCPTPCSRSTGVQSARLQVLQEGRVNLVPVLVGANSGEGILNSAQYILRPDLLAEHFQVKTVKKYFISLISPNL